MFFDKNIKYRDILIFALIGVVGYKLIDNYSVFFDFISRFMSMLSPFVYALVIAYVLNPIMKFFEKRLKFNRTIAITSTYVLIFGIIVIGCVFVVPNIVDSIINMTTEVPKYVVIVQSWINDLLKNKNLYDMISQAGLLDYLSSLSSNFGKILINILEGSVSSIYSFTTNLIKIILGILIAIYVLADKERLIKQTKTFMYMVFKEKIASSAISWIKTYDKMIATYIGIKAIDSAIIGVIILIGLLIMGAPYAMIIALISAITNMIPYIGPLFGELVGVFVGIFVSPSMAIMIFIFIFSVHQFDAWFLDPKLVGGKVGVQPVFIVFGLTIAGGFFGIPGMLLASPTVATIKIFYENRVRAFKEKNENLSYLFEDDNDVDLKGKKKTKEQEKVSLDEK